MDAGEQARPCGFTLLEMMVVLLIAGILLAAGVPALQGFAARQQLSAATNAFFHGIGLTRSAALRHGRPVRMVPVNGSDWRRGWHIVSGDPASVVPLMTQPALPAGITVSHTNGGGIIGFRPNGLPLTSGSWRFVSGERTHLVVINFLGRARICVVPPDKTTC